MPKKYECDLCGEKFKKKKHLHMHKGMEHRKEAIKEIGIKCPECGKEFESEEVLSVHQKEVHGKQTGKESKPSEERDVEEGGKEGKSVPDKISLPSKGEFVKKYWISIVFLAILVGFLILQNPNISLEGRPSERQGTSPPEALEPQETGNTTQSSLPQYSGELPEKTEYNKCEKHKDCTPTCCGPRNQEYRGQCSKSCDKSELHVAACVQGRCVITDQPLPESAY